MYSYIRQNAIINDFIRLGPVALKTLTPTHGRAVIKRDKFSVEIANFSKLISININAGLKTSAYRLLDAIILYFTEHNCGHEILLNLEDYMKLCFHSDVKEARRKINNDLEMLGALTISYAEKKRSYSIKFFETAAIKNSIITVVLDNDFSEIMGNSYIMPFPRAMFSIKADKNPNSYYILRKIIEHKNMNFGKPNENTISAKTLLEAAPLIPKVKDVRGTLNHSIYKRIFIPFYRDLRQACEIINVDFSLSRKRDGNDINCEELKGFLFEDFCSDVYIHLSQSWPEYPVRETRIKRTQKRKTAAKKMEGEIQH